MTDESRTAELEARLARLEGQTSGGDEGRRRPDTSGAETALWSLLRALFPEDTRRHMRAATREQLLAARSYIDHWLARLDEREAPTEELEREQIPIE